MDNMRVLGIERSMTAGGHYRIVQPLYKMLEHNLANILTINEKNAADIGFIVEKIIESEVILFQRPSDSKWLDLMKIAQKYGKTIVIDYDDDPFSTHPLNPAYKWHGVEEVPYIDDDGNESMIWEDGVNGFSIEANIKRRYMFRAGFKNADMVTTTTDILKKTFSKINKNTIALPNLIDFNIFQPIEMKKKEVRILWQGGNSHYHDLYMIVPAIKKIIKKYDNVTFVFFGDFGFKGLFKDIPEGRIEYNSWVQQVAYPYKMMTLNADINLCPIIDDVFNRSKSSLKYLEASALKIPSIASDIPPYSKDITHGKDGILVSEDKWFDAIENLILDRDKRLKLANNAYDNVYNNFNADTKCHLWKDAYYNLLKSDIKEYA